ncbi:YaiI/YqxD family protein [Acetivibrio cellulolyticus]|uniref:YaiI/YqxD family protein n=1 Tax=Acetivibrio cellulolyticus TaxID=35830 RepID=UPI0001E2E7B2|nr:YaiI/YqxD family protein [Acetivibrio cellulolyticus]
MNILVDADACPVKQIIVKIAKEEKIHVIMFIDTSHVIDDGYSEVVTVDKARDSVDFALVNKVQKGDIVVTQDYGVAAMALAKGARAINQNGIVYSDENMNKLLFERHISQKVRRSGNRVSGPSKRTKEHDERFENAFKQLLSNT